MIRRVKLVYLTGTKMPAGIGVMTDLIGPEEEIEIEVPTEEEQSLSKRTLARMGRTGRKDMKSMVDGRTEQGKNLAMEEDEERRVRMMKFVLAFIDTGNIIRAQELAGYEKASHVQGYALLKHPFCSQMLSSNIPESVIAEMAKASVRNGLWAMAEAKKVLDTVLKQQNVKATSKLQAIRSFVEMADKVGRFHGQSNEVKKVEVEGTFAAWIKQVKEDSTRVVDIGGGTDSIPPPPSVVDVQSGEEEGEAVGGSRPEGDGGKVGDKRKDGGEVQEEVLDIE